MFLFICFLFVFRKKYGAMAGMFECGASDTNFGAEFFCVEEIIWGGPYFLNGN